MKSIGTRFLLSLFLVISFGQLVKGQASEAIRKYTENITAGIPTEIRGEMIYSTTLLPEFYFENQFYRIWNRPLQSTYLGLLKKASEHGLNPAD
ncbi:MAG TPA: hypothetical protein VIN11_08685, partial [Roseivirga sp.]